MRNLDDVKVGDKLIHRRGGVYGRNAILEVSKVTEKQLTCTNGERYMKSTGVAVGMRDSWSGGSVWKATEKDIESVSMQDRVFKAKEAIKTVIVNDKTVEAVEEFLKQMNKIMGNS